MTSFMEFMFSTSTEKKIPPLFFYIERLTKNLQSLATQVYFWTETETIKASLRESGKLKCPDISIYMWNHFMSVNVDYTYC